MVFGSSAIRNVIRTMPLRIKLNPKTDHDDFQHDAELPKIPKSLLTPACFHQAYSNNLPKIAYFRPVIHQIPNLTGSPVKIGNCLHLCRLQGGDKVHKKQFGVPMRNLGDFGSDGQVVGVFEDGLLGL